jgi:hypothetical protein
MIDRPIDHPHRYRVGWLTREKQYIVWDEYNRRIVLRGSFDEVVRGVIECNATRCSWSLSRPIPCAGHARRH